VTLRARRLALFALLVPPFVAAACGGNVAHQSSSTHPTPAPTASAMPEAPRGLLVQEWGTYTSVQASDGHALGGVHHVDEALPTWVHRRNFTDRSNYYFEQLPEEPMQQLETPVLYFWSSTAQSLSVTVTFPKGIVGEWYPDAMQFAPPINGLTSIAGGAMTWNVTVDPAIDAARFAPVTPTEIWAPSRQVASTPVRATSPSSGAETEQFVFYRGLGTFDASVRVVATDGELRVSNGSADEIPAAFVLRVAQSGGTIVPIGAIPAASTLVVPIPSASMALDAYVAQAQDALHTALVETSLNDDVATAMVNTWTRSWFTNTGLRILYLAPRSWPDGWLPTSVEPAPSSFVRTFVGRIETLTPSQENELLAQVQAYGQGGAPVDIASLGRFAEARLWRAQELVNAPQDAAYVKTLIDAAHAQP
jgi:hypothetical protein